MRGILAPAEESGSWRDLVRPGMRTALTIACALAIFQQITGASILLMYMPTVFQEAGFTHPSDAIRLNVFLNLWSVVCTVVALVLVDRLGRRPLLSFGTLGMAVGMVAVGALFQFHKTGMYVFYPMLLVNGAYLISLAPLAWLIMAEIFPNRLRGKAMGVASVCVWVAAFGTAYGFPKMVDRFEARFGTPGPAFWVFAAVSGAAFLFSLVAVPETKGRTLEEIGASWSK